MTVTGSKALLLLSGGVDSTSVAAWTRPELAVSIDYGQVCARAERAAVEIGLPVRHLQLSAAELGRGLLAEPFDGRDVGDDGGAAEFWPFRNQLLITAAAAVAYDAGLSRVLVGTVRTDGSRHVDGTVEFVQRMSELCGMQEGGISVDAPAIEMSTVELVEVSEAPMSLLGWTHSCHTGDVACGRCPGCAKRNAVFNDLDSRR